MMELTIHYTDSQENRRRAMHFYSLVEFIGMYCRGDLSYLEDKVTDILAIFYSTHTKKYATLECLHNDLIAGTFIKKE